MSSDSCVSFLQECIMCVCVCVCVNQTCSQKVCVLQVCCWLKDFRVSYDNDNDENVRNQPV